MQQTVEQHGPVARGQDKAVTIKPVRTGRVVFEKTGRVDTQMIQLGGKEVRRGSRVHCHPPSRSKKRIGEPISLILVHKTRSASGLVPGCPARAFRCRRKQLLTHRRVLVEIGGGVMSYRL